MKSFCIALTVGLLLGGSVAAQQAGGDASGAPVVVHCAAGNGQVTACNPKSERATVVLVSGGNQREKRISLQNIPWMIGAFQ